MKHTFDPGDKVLVIRFWPFRWLRNGDIVLVKSPSTSEADRALAVSGNKYLIKRVYGLPGDKVITKMAKIPELAQIDGPFETDSYGNRTWMVPDDHLFVMGDLPGFDSSMWGPLSKGSLAGLVVKKLRPRSNRAFSS